MKRNTLEPLLYSAAGVLCMLGMLVAANVVLSRAPLRADLTADKAYTLSAGTKDLLRKLDTPIKIRLYVTQPEISTPETIFLKNYARKVEDLLAEYKQVAGRNIIIEKYDPQPESDAEDSARLDGLESQPIAGMERFYLGLAVGLADSRTAIPFLAPNRERQLEYDLTRAISQLVRPEKPVVGILSPLPVFGMQSNPMMAQMGQQGSPTWTIVNELKADYNVRRVGMEVEKIDDDIRVLFVIHPKEITDRAQFAIDQFVLRGGKLIAFVDPLAKIDSRSSSPMGGMQSASSSSLDKLFRVWGVQLEAGKIVMDRQLSLRVPGRNGPSPYPSIVALTPEFISRDDIATAELDNVWFPWTGALTISSNATLKARTLMHSSKAAGLVDGFLANLSPESAEKELKPSGTEYILGAMLTGKFKTAFPEGKPKDATEAPGSTNNAAPPPENSLKESASDNTVVIIADADLLADPFTVQEVQGLMGPVALPLNQNLILALNLVDQMAGDNRLASMRSRASTTRPFTRMQEIQAKAENLFRAKIKEIEDERTQAQQRLNELQAQKDKDQKFILSPQQKDEIEKLRKTEGLKGRELRQLQKDLRREVVALETKLKWVNILAVPLAITFAGIVIAVVKRKRTSAK